MCIHPPVTMSLTDFLVLHVIEYDMTLKSEGRKNYSDTSLYIYYDCESNMYYIHGKRGGVNSTYEPFSFMADTPVNVLKFIRICIDTTAELSYELYSVRDLPCYNHEIDHDLLANHCHTMNEIVAYDDIKFKNIVNAVHLLNKIYNDYDFNVCNENECSESESVDYTINWENS